MYVLAYLRNVLQDTDCSAAITPNDERNRLVQLIGSDDDFGLNETDSKVRWGLKKLLVETQDQLLREVTQATQESIEKDVANARERLQRAEVAVSSAEDRLKTLIIEQKFGIYLRGQVAEPLPAEYRPSSSRYNEVTDNGQTILEQGTMSIPGCMRLIEETLRGQVQKQNQYAIDRIDKAILDAAERIKETKEIIARNQAEVVAAQREVQKMEQKLQIKKSIMGYTVGN
jgi:hypothetical protein